jgi:hypothetical protein
MPLSFINTGNGPNQGGGEPIGHGTWVKINQNFQYVEDVSGTSPMEASVIAAAQQHLLDTNRNPHGLTVDDLDVYTKGQVDTLLAERSTQLNGGTIP